MYTNIIKCSMVLTKYHAKLNTLVVHLTWQIYKRGIEKVQYTL